MEFPVDLGGSRLDRFWPVGSIYLSVVNQNPSLIFRGGTWVAFGTGRTLVGIDTNDTDFNAAEKTFGEKNHTLTATEMPVHTHTQNAHNHTVTDPTHTHTQNAHTHTQNSHTHGEQVQGGTTGTTTGTHVMGSAATGGSLRSAGESTLAATAVNNNATATNNNAATGVSVDNATATNNNAGGDGSHNNVQPSIVVYMWKRTA